MVSAFGAFPISFPVIGLCRSRGSSFPFLLNSMALLVQRHQRSHLPLNPEILVSRLCSNCLLCLLLLSLLLGFPLFPFLLLCTKLSEHSALFRS